MKSDCEMYLTVTLKILDVILQDSDSQLLDGKPDASKSPRKFLKQNPKQF